MGATGSKRCGVSRKIEVSVTHKGYAGSPLREFESRSRYKIAAEVGADVYAKQVPMDISDVDHKILIWLRGLGSEPDYTYQTNTRSYNQAASMAAAALNIASDQLRDRFEALAREGLVELVSRAGLSGVYYARITEDGREELRRPIPLDYGAPIVFVSCGQMTDDERALGAAVASLIDKETPAQSYFAENQATFDGVSTNILGALSRCVGFVGIMHHRGALSNSNGETYQRASVWIEQEIAIASYRIQTLKDPITVQLYVQRGIKREGLRDKIMLNPLEFETNDEVLEHFRSIVRERFGGLSEVATSDFQATLPDSVTSATHLTQTPECEA